MKIGKVIGNIVSTKKVSNTNACKILVVRYLDAEMRETEKTEACIDTTGAGSGDVVLLCSSSSARQTDKTKNVCTDNTIIGIIDSVSFCGEFIFNRSCGNYE